MLRLAIVVLWAHLGTGAILTRTRASVPAAVLSFIAAIAYLLLSWWEHVRTVRPSFEIEMYLFSATLLNLARARTLWMLLQKHSTAIPVVFTVSLVVQAVGILCESWEKRAMLRQPFSAWASESLSGTFNRTFFCWLCPLLLKGNRQLLTLPDLPPLDPKLEADELQFEFSQAWDKGATEPLPVLSY